MKEFIFNLFMANIGLWIGLIPMLLLIEMIFGKFSPSVYYVSGVIIFIISFFASASFSHNKKSLNKN